MHHSDAMERREDRNACPRMQSETVVHASAADALLTLPPPGQGYRIWSI